MADKPWFKAVPGRKVRTRVRVKPPSAEGDEPRGVQLELGGDGTLGRYKIRKTPASQERMRWSGYKIGGYPWSGFIDPDSVPICEHDHGKVDARTQGLLVRQCLAPAFFRLSCLTEPWKGYVSGTPLITYGRGVWPAHGYTLWIDLQAQGTMFPGEEA